LFAYGQAIAAHMQRCFDVEAALSLQINAATGADELHAIAFDFLVVLNGAADV
jgi:hypothetical protein